MAKKKRFKVWKIMGGVLLVFISLLVAIPIFFQKKIATIIKEKVNQNINGTFDFADADLSLLKSFPNAHVDLNRVSLVNKAPFAGDTLFGTKNIALTMSIAQLFKSTSESIAIKRFSLDGMLVHIKIDAEGNANYDIALENNETAAQASSESAESAPSSFSLFLQEYALNNATILYDDFSTGMHLELLEVNHSGSGDLSAVQSKLDTHTDALVSFEMENTNYLNKNKIRLDALIGVDLEKSKYTFMDNMALVNKLPLVFNGYVQLTDVGQNVDISFKTPSSAFENFLALIPESYSNNIEGVTTTGNFAVDGKVKGLVTDDRIPAFNIRLNSENASFKYPDLPKTVKNVFIDAVINNETGISKDTYIDLRKLSFQIDEDQFNMNASFRELLGNPRIRIMADGVVNLANISKAYPLDEDYGLTGWLSSDIKANFDMAALENKQYEKTETSGNLQLKGFHYESAELKNTIDISEASLTFNPSTVTLNNFEGKSGQSDFKANGTLTNLLGYVFNNENIEGNFILSSNNLVLDDFMVEETVENNETEENGDANKNEPETLATGRMTIPSFLSCTIDATAQKVAYNGLTLNNLHGQLLIKDQIAVLKNLTSSIFGGTLGVSGTINTKEPISTFDMGLDIKNFGIEESFQSMDMLKMLAPVASALKGKLNSTVQFSGNLKDDMTPNLSTLSGNLLAELFGAKVDTKDNSMLSSFDSQFDFINLRDLKLDDLKAAMSFNDGKVNLKPFDINYQDIAIQVGGNHTFDNQMQYQATLNVPAKYLGSEVSGLIAELGEKEAENITVPVTANITGNSKNPKITTDLAASAKNLTSQLVNIKKQKLLNEGKGKVTSLLNNVLNNGEDKNAKDGKSTKVSETLGKLLGEKNKNASDTTNTNQNENKVKNAAKNVLGGLFGKKKKDTTQN